MKGIVRSERIGKKHSRSTFLVVKYELVNLSLLLSFCLSTMRKRSEKLIEADRDVQFVSSKCSLSSRKEISVVLSIFPKNERRNKSEKRYAV